MSESTPAPRVNLKYTGDVALGVIDIGILDDPPSAPAAPRRRPPLWLARAAGVLLLSGSFGLWAALHPGAGFFALALLASLLVGTVVALGLRATLVAGRRARRATGERDALERLLLVLSDLDEGVAILEHDRFIYANEALARLAGLSVPELLALPSSADLLDPDMAKPFRDNLRGVAAGEALAHHETVLRRPTGERIEIEISTKLLEPYGSGRRLSLARDISAPRAAQRALAESERKFRALIQHSSDAIFVIDAEGRERFRSDAVERIFGYSPSVDVGGSPLAWVHPDDQPLVMESLEELVTKPEGTLSSEIRVRHQDGTWRHVELTATNMLLEPAVRGVVFNTRDISDRRAAEAALRESEDRFRSIFTWTGVAAALVAPDGSFLEVNDAYCRMHGYSREELMQLGLRDVVHPDDQVWGFQAASALAREEATQVEFEQRHVRKDGSLVEVHVGVSAVRDGEGRVKYVVDMMQDITRRKAAEEGLKASERRFRALIEHSSDATAIVDRQGRLCYISPSWSRQFGFSVEEVRDLPAVNWIHPGDAKGALNVFASVMASPGAVEHTNVRIRHKDGRWRDIDAVVTNLLDDPAVGGVVINARDVTSRREAEREMEKALKAEREAVERLRALDDLKDSFLTAVSHELRTPLSSVLGGALTLERTDIELDDATREDLTRAVAGNARKLSRLLTDLLDLDRLKRGILEPVREPVDLAALVRDLVRSSESLNAHPVIVDTEPVVIAADASKLERIVENLLANATRHTPADSAIHIAVKAVDGGAELLVEDDGPGVPSELREAIFQPFNRGNGGGLHAPGVGIGLSLVSKFAELHGGRVWVEERTGGGASFHVYLPTDATQSGP